MKRRFFPRCAGGSVAAAISLLLGACAGQAPPRGGPEDVTPPAIVRTYPDSGAVRVKPDRIELEFNKYVDRRSVEESIFISPYLGEMEFDWSGREVTVTFAEPLRDSITYVLNVGTDVVDVRSRTRMSAGYSLPFSTGDSIDRGGIDGRIFDEKGEGIMIFAYALAQRQADTLDPSRVRPDYVTQSGKEGRYALSNLALGSYRVFAVADEFRNLLYDKETDRFGVLRGDVTLTAERPRVSDLDFRLSREDTTKPFVTGAAARNAQTVQVRFNEPLDSLALPGISFTLRDTVRGVTLALLAQYFDDPGKPLVTLVTKEPLDSTGVFEVIARNARDYAGNVIDSLHAAALFSGTAVPDSSRVTVAVAGVSDTARGFRVDAPLRFTFSKPVRRPSAVRAVELSDTAGRAVSLEPEWLDPIRLLLRPRAPLIERTAYRIRVVLDSLSDLRGLSTPDSTVLLKFKTQDLRMTGSLSGVIAPFPGESPSGPVYVQASGTRGLEGEGKTVRRARPGGFLVDRLLEGKYVVSGFLDADSSGTYRYGKPYPFIPSEEFAVHRDTLKVRARWSVENVMLQLH